MKSQLSVLKDCINLSSGTLSTPTGHRQYTVLDQIGEQFVSYVVDQISCGSAFASWREAWACFKAEQSLPVLTVDM